jgi:Acetyltransferase (isoleucine patch superfamily)
MAKQDHKKRMLAGLPYRCGMDGLDADRMDAKKKLRIFNSLPPDDTEAIAKALQGILGSCGKDAFIEAPFRCDYGYNIQVGDCFFANYNLTVLDVNKVIIGNNVMLAPNVSIYTAGHPLHPVSRNSGYEYGLEIRIGDDVWIGGNTVILPGIAIGRGTVIGAGSVVTRDVPENTLAAGNPCRCIRSITEADRDFYYKDRLFDVDDY